jgi:3'5'-cyclic nucleotide phosphodiesterase
MFNFLLLKGNLAKKLDLGQVEILSMIIGAACHDFGHDGFTNDFHKKSSSERAIRFNDQSVQENYHASESFALLKREEMNFLHTLTRDEQRLFRRRAMEAILATDLAMHFEHQDHMQKVLDSCNVQKGENFEQLFKEPAGQTHEQLFKKKQLILNYCMHACDVSQ